MIRRAIQLFCDNEHGCGDVVFPESGDVDFVQPYSNRTLRQEAKKQGWSRQMKSDYCPGCTENFREEAGEHRRSRKVA